MIITHFVAEWNGSTFDFKAEERSGATVIASYTFGSATSFNIINVLKSLETSGLMNNNALEIKVGSTVFNP